MSELAKWGTYRYFTKNEFLCPCCGEEHMAHEFVRKLDMIRHMYGLPLIVNSGWRCPDHNENISTTGRSGPHTTGRAVDLGVHRGNLVRLLSSLHVVASDLAGDEFNEYFMTGLGFKQHGPTAGRFIHLDDLEAPTHPRPNVWSYK